MAASVTLKTVWLNSATNPSDYKSFPMLSELQVTPSIQGSVVPYANDRLRVINRSRVSNEINLTLPECERDQIEWLTAHIGQIMCFRDDRGLRIFAAYFAAPRVENSGDTTGNVTLKLNEVTFTDVV